MKSGPGPGEILVSGPGPGEILVCDVTNPFEFQDAKDDLLCFGRRSERYVRS